MPDSTVVIAGAFEGPSGITGTSAFELFVQGAAGAMRDAGVSGSEVDGLLTSYSWEEPRLMPSDFLAEYLGAAPVYTETVTLGGAGPLGMLGRAERAIRSGLCETVVLASASNRASGLGKEAAIDSLREVAHPLYEAPFGAFVPALYALFAQRHAHLFGDAERSMAAIAASQRGYAALKPGAARQEPLSIEDAIASKMISEPLRITDCCLLTDFSAGLVVTTEARARERGERYVSVLGYGEARDFDNVSQSAALEPTSMAAAGALAFARAGVAPEEVDFAELYDCFTITVLLTLQSLGLCGRGEAPPLERLPVNTNGGMLSFATGGMYHLTEAVSQLRGEAGARQVADARVGVVTGVGGVFSANCAAVLGAAR